MKSRTHVRRWRKAVALLSTIALTTLGSGSTGQAAADTDRAVDKLPTETPIKHVIIIVGENRSFDHLFATYQPVRKHERVLNLRSQGIINADGTPGPNFARAQQFKIVAPPNGGKFFISADLTQKQLYGVLPPPNVAGAPKTPPFFGKTDVGLGPASSAAQALLSTGGTGLPFSSGPDTRITGVNTLPPGPFQMTGPLMPYDAYTSDTIHQYLPDVPADGLRHRRGARLARQPDGMPARSPVGDHDDLQHAAHRHADRHGPDDGVLQHAAGRRAALQATGRRIHDERQLPPAGDGRNRP